MLPLTILNIFPLCLLLALFHTGGGVIEPPWWMTSRDSSVDARNEFKFHDFVSFNIYHVPLKPFFKKIFWKFEKRNFFFQPFRLQRVPPLKIFFSKLFFSIFLVTNHTFSTWICILHVLSFLLRYITWVLVKIFKFSFFTIEFLSITKFFLRPLMAKLIIKKGCFWYVWIGKDQNFALRTVLGHFHANWLP